MLLFKNPRPMANISLEVFYAARLVGHIVMNQPSIYPLPLPLIGIEITFYKCVLQSIE